jgi:hypothetical protein
MRNGNVAFGTHHQSPCTPLTNIIDRYEVNIFLVALEWDIFTGTEIARFASFDHLRIASWMRNRGRFEQDHLTLAISLF